MSSESTLADCPNACSQPQIKDVGIIGASVPETTNEACSHAEHAARLVRSRRLTLAADGRPPAIELGRCLNCGQCVRACPTGTIAEAWNGFRVQLGGRLGRHPRLGRELPGIFSEDQVIEILAGMSGVLQGAQPARGALCPPSSGR